MVVILLKLIVSVMGSHFGYLLQAPKDRATAQHPLKCSCRLVIQ